MSQANPQCPIDKVDEKLSQNERNLLTMQNFLQSKRVEIYQLQNFLIKEFQSIQGWNEQKQKITALLKNDIKNIILDMKIMIKHLFAQVHQITFNIVNEITKAYQIKIDKQQKDIQEKEIKIKQQQAQIQKLRQIGEKRLNSPGFSNLKQISREVSQNRQNQISKSLTKSSFIEFHLDRLKLKSREKIKDSNSRSNLYGIEIEEKILQKSNLLDRNDKGLRSYKNFCEQENKLSKSPVKKRVTYQIQRVEKQDFQNKGHIEHKRYVKQKIECLKSKNSGIFNECRPLKMERRF